VIISHRKDAAFICDNLPRDGSGDQREGLSRHKGALNKKEEDLNPNKPASALSGHHLLKVKRRRLWLEMTAL
jgi:hypothetical protein